MEADSYSWQRILGWDAVLKQGGSFNHRLGFVNGFRESFQHNKQEKGPAAL